MRNNKRPAWVPQWIWDEGMNVVPRGTSEIDVEHAAIIEKILMDRGCEAVWGAITRRRGKLHSARLAFMRSKGWREDPVSPGEAESLFDAAADAYFGPRLIDQFSATDRRNVGNRITKLALALRDELRSIHLPSLFGDVDEYPQEIESAFDVHAGACYVGSYSVTAGGARREFSDYELEYINLGAMFSAQKIGDLLARLAEGAKAWGKTKPPIKQLNAQDAGRLYFVRAMTEFFRKNYGTPLRAAVAALASCLYECSMDGATIAKLAP
jgi:hypothetical protein